MSRRKSENEEGSREGKKSEDKMLSEFESKVKELISKYKISRETLPKKADEELDIIIEKIVNEYFE